jgi:hypothetical protein
MNDCEEIVEHRLIVREENKRKITLVNEVEEPVKIVEVDGCKITKGNRCDWLFVHINNQAEIFVELKGSDIKHACLQIETTIHQLTMDLEKLKYAIVVCSRVSPSINPTIQTFKKKFKKRLRAFLIIRQKECCFDLSRRKEIDCSTI